MPCMCGDSQCPSCGAAQGTIDHEGYQVILADPPWQYNDKCLHRGGAERHYRTQEIEWIADLPIKELAARDCVLFLWATWPKLAEAFRVIDVWGFTYKTIAFLWVKKYRQTDMFKPTNFWGMGRWTRSNTEPCLLAIRGKPKRESGGVHSVIEAVPGPHSAKPHDLVNAGRRGAHYMNPKREEVSEWT